MSKSIYLFEEHENYQAGKTQLKREAIPQTPLLMVFAIWGCGFCLLFQALGGYHEYYHSLNVTENARLVPQSRPDALFLWSIPLFASLFFVIKSIGKLLKNIQAKQRYERLKLAELILTGKITKVKFQHDKQGQIIACSAKYQFVDPHGKQIKATVRDYYDYKLPEHLAIGDTISILYRDDKTYCVL